MPKLRLSQNALLPLDDPFTSDNLAVLGGEGSYYGNSGVLEDQFSPSLKFNEELYAKALQFIINGNVISFSETLQDIPNVNMSTPADQNNTLLHWCVLYNNVHMAKMLLESGASLLANSLGKTPLELAKDMCEAGDFSYIEMRNVLQQGLRRARKRST